MWNKESFETAEEAIVFFAFWLDAAGLSMFTAEQCARDPEVIVCGPVWFEWRTLRVGVSDYLIDTRRRTIQCAFDTIIDILDQAH